MKHLALRLRRVFLALVLSVLPGLAVAPWSAVAAAVSMVEPAALPARVIVTYRADAPLLQAHPVGRDAVRSQVQAAHQRRADALGRRAGLALTAGRVVGSRAHVVLARGMSSQQLAARLASDPNVLAVDVDQRRRAFLVPNDPLFTAGTVSRGPADGQWYLKAPSDVIRSATNVQAAWDRTTGSASIVVAVLDTGVLPDHEDLQGRFLPGYDMIKDAAVANDGDSRDSDASDPGDWVTAAEANDATGAFYKCTTQDSSGKYVAENSSWHGTQVSGIVGAATNNRLGMAGIAHGSRILPVRVLGKCGGYDSDIAAGMRWAAGIHLAGIPDNPNPARVINLSLGGTGACNTTYRTVVDEVTAAGAVIVAAAGNSTGHAVGMPGNCSGVIAVAGLRHVGTKVGFSDLGPEIAISAPGGNCVNLSGPCLYPILTTSNSGTTRPNAGGSIYTDSYFSSLGTSFSSPIVAGTVALMLSAQPKLTPAEVRQALQASARPFPTSGADNTDGTPVAQCKVPDGTDQLQCYCTTAVCGAGMLDAAAAVARAADRPYARVDLLTTTPVAGSDVQFSADSTLVGNGHPLTTYLWTLVDGGGVVTGFSGATNASTAAVKASAAGTVVVRLTVTDNAGAQSSAERSVTIAAAPVPPPTPVTPPATGGGSSGSSSATGSSGSSGGGAMSGAWLAGLAWAAWLLGRPSRSSRRARPLR